MSSHWSDEEESLILNAYETLDSASGPANKQHHRADPNPNKLRREASHKPRTADPHKPRREFVIPDIGNEYDVVRYMQFEQCPVEDAVCKSVAPLVDHPAAVCAAVLGGSCLNFTFATMQEPYEVVSFKIPRVSNFINNVMVSNRTNFMNVDDTIKKFLNKIKNFTIYTICKQLSDQQIDELYNLYDISIVPRPWTTFKYCTTCMMWSCQKIQEASAHNFISCSKCLMAMFLKTYAHDVVYSLYGW